MSRIQIVRPTDATVAEDVLLSYLSQAKTYEDARVIFQQQSKKMPVLAQNGETVDKYVRC